MKYRKFLFVLALCIISLLSGCGQGSGEVSDIAFMTYDIESIMPKIEYKVCDRTERFIVYFPVVTSKEITGTELGGVAAKLPSARDNIKVTLHSMSQDAINYPYRNKYVSFLKYRVDIEDKEFLQANDVVTLCDTTLWIYHHSEFQKIRMDSEYLQITIVDDEKDRVLPDWNRIIANMRANMEFEF